MLGMKRFYFLVFVLLGVANGFAAENPVSVKSGDVSVFKEKAVMNVVFAFENATVGDSVSIDEYYAAKEDEDLESFKTSFDNANVVLAERFNKKKGKKIGVTLFAGESIESKYTMVFDVYNMELGFAGGSFIPFTDGKTGGMELTGILRIKDKSTGNVVCELNVDGVTGVSSYTFNQRAQMVCWELAKQLIKAVK